MSSRELVHRGKKTDSRQRTSNLTRKDDAPPNQKQSLSTVLIERDMAEPHRLTTLEVLQLQQPLGNRTISHLLEKNAVQRAGIRDPHQHFTRLDIVQRTPFDDVENKAKTNQTILQDELEAAVKFYLMDLVRDQGYRDGQGNPIGPEEMDHTQIFWGSDYTGGSGLLLLPTVQKVIADIKSGSFKMIIGHELGHIIKNTAEPKTGQFDAIEAIINEVDWVAKKRQHPICIIDAWKEEVRADLKSVRENYLREKRFPTESELNAYQASITFQGEPDSEHPTGAFRASQMRKYIAQTRPSKICFLTTACAEAKGLQDDCEELTVLRHFHDRYLLKKPHGEELVELYYRYAPGIVQKIDQDPQRNEIYAYIYSVLRDCVEAIKRNELEYAYRTYCEMVIKLKNIFIPDEQISDYTI